MRAQRKFGTCLSGLLVVGLAATSCTTTQKTTPTPRNTTKPIRAAKVTYNYTAKDKDCLERVMYFESQHSDPGGYMAVGTVVMNRLTSGAYPPTICGVVSQERQFAPGLMTKEVKDQAKPDLDVAASAILRGERHPQVKDAMFFHTQGLRFPYDNMHYVAIAGGNAFYEKRGRDGELQTPAPLPAYEVAMNYVSNQGGSQSPFVLPEMQPLQQQAPSVATFTPVSNPTVSISAAPATIPAAVPIPTPAPTSMSISGPITDANAFVAPTATPMPVSTVVIPQPRPEFQGTGANFSTTSPRIRG
ncbi:MULTISPECIES: cell wall hydrolase [Rhizobium]|uniref:Cell wall hydrolase CwlJ, involved in spore germination n=1 Tax=Rhizobium miluonense TaxID=411945 RepID=A0A1C3X0L3_9HYPH|nr:cell wall hydrolase [Rhizobium miluonense]SCB45773.1 Cell wall hydrolase CwlJ, involved in spore germination [Rhizobium miluonense]